MNYRTSFLYGGNLIMYQYLDIDRINVKYTKQTSIFGLTSDEVVIPRKYIRKVMIKNNIIGCNVYIHFTYIFNRNEGYICLNGVKKEDGREIRRILMGY